MAYIILEGELPADLPTKKDGSSYPFGLASKDRVVLADTRTELVEQLIEGYADIPRTQQGDEDSLWARYTSCAAVATQYQQILAADAVEAGTFDTTLESEDVLTAIFTPRGEKVALPEAWNHAVPLVLLSADYAPFSSTPAPTGNIKWLNPFNETTYLDTLEALGAITMFVAAEA